MTTETLVPDQSIRDIQRRRWARPMVPHLLTLPCPMSKCAGLQTFTGRSFTEGMGPLINIHTCGRCGARQDIADDYYPRIEYRTEDGRSINLMTGQAELR
jgi:hypothetical protein